MTAAQSLPGWLPALWIATRMLELRNDVAGRSRCRAHCQHRGGDSRWARPRTRPATCRRWARWPTQSPWGAALAAAPAACAAARPAARMVGVPILGLAPLDSAASTDAAAGTDIESFEEYVAARREREGNGRSWRSDRNDEASTSSGANVPDRCHSAGLNFAPATSAIRLGPLRLVQQLQVPDGRPSSAELRSASC